MKEKVAGVKRLVFSPKRSITVVMMLIIWAGAMGSIFAALSYDLRSRDFLKGRIQTISAALPATEIAELSGSQSDLENASYLDLKDRMQLIRSNNPDVTSVYLLGIKDSSVVWYADSGVPGAKPGAVFAATNTALKEGFSSSGPFIQGPTREGHNARISAYAPITDPDTYEIIALVGMDLPATDYYTPLIAYALVPLLLAAIPLAGLLRDNKLAAKQWELIQLKNQFVSIASHELRSPLNGLLWAIQSLMKSTVSTDKTAQDLLEDMYRSTEASLVTVNEILDFSIFDRNQAGKLQKDKVDLASVLRDVTNTLRLGAKEKGLILRFEGHWPAEALTTGDAGALKRAYMNIISNAIKYSPENSEITYRYKLREDKHIIMITDHGIGIPEAEQTKVLNGYYRATNATKVQAHGTGLGLWVTRLVVEQHGGELRLESKENQGTTIYASFPAATVADGTEKLNQ
jgi:signal transduction histidine kinase